MNTWSLILGAYTLAGQADTKDIIILPLDKYNDGEKQQVLLGHQEKIHNLTSRTGN